MPDPDDAPLLLTIPRAAAILGISRRTAYTAVAKGGIRTVKLYDGGQAYIPRSEIDRLTAVRPQRSHLAAWHESQGVA